MNEKAYIQNYGCQMNEHDSFRMMEVLRSIGCQPATDPAGASIILVNTCAVRENPENKVFSYLGALKKLKRRNPDLIVIVAGCVAQEHGQTILDRSPVVNIVLGPDNIYRLPEFIQAARQGQRIIATDWLPRDGKVQNFIPEPWLETGHTDGCRSFIAIMKGCNNFCSFCIVPYVRGREVSREPGNILQEAQALIAHGASEIWLLGQNVNSYQAGGWQFHQLLQAVSQLPGLKRLRFTSPHPKDWTNDLADLMAHSPVICNHLHLPFQAGADRILERMNRRHTIQDYLDKVDYLKATVPGVEISTDLIVGFPTETEEEFQQTLNVVERVKFSQIFPFKYSTRPGTKAADFPDDIPRKTKEERLARVIALQDQIDRQAMQAYIGTTQTVLIEGLHPKQPGVYSGRTNGYRPVSVHASDLQLGALPIGSLVDVTITGISGHWLQAT